MFELRKRDGLARICEFTTGHGTVTTPTLLPVINPNINLIPAEEMRRKFGTQMVITNSYIIRKGEELRAVALEKGVHSLLGTDIPVMTDSGTFQSYVYGKVSVDPQEIVEFQRDIGVDVGTILDVFSTPDRTHDEAGRDVEETLLRAGKAASIKGNMALAGTVQGSVYPDLRKHCAEAMSRMPLDFHPIGGVVPLMESGRYAELTELIIAAKTGLTHARPVHLFGAGHPLYLPVAALLGCDFFDSSSYAKYARGDRMMFPWGTRKLMTMRESPCCCPVCSSTTIAEMRTLEKAQRTRLLAEHNLHVLFSEIRDIRDAIEYGNLWDMVERRCLGHPRMKGVLEVLKRKRDVLEAFEPVYRDAPLTVTGLQSVERPLLARFRKRVLERYRLPPSRILVALPDGERPYSRGQSDRVKRIRKIAPDTCFVFISPFGPVPMELDEVYPAAQSIYPDTRELVLERAVTDWMEDFSHGLDGSRLSLVWQEGVLDSIRMLLPASTGDGRGFGAGADDDLRRVRAITDFQFGAGISEVFFHEFWSREEALDANLEIDIVKSRKTKKIRNVLVNGKHILSMRAHDGLFTLKKEGARMIHANRPGSSSVSAGAASVESAAPFMRVVVVDDSVEFNRQGKNVFAGFVMEADPSLRPGDECLVVDTRDTLVAIGRTILTAPEMRDFNNGMAVKVRDGFGLEN